MNTATHTETHTEELHVHTNTHIHTHILTGIHESRQIIRMLTDTDVVAATGSSIFPLITDSVRRLTSGERIPDKNSMAKRLAWISTILSNL